MNCKHSPHIKGIKEDDILGKILSANFIPYKYCDYNCVYCGVGPTTNKVIQREEFYPPEVVFSEIKDYLTKNNSIDYVWLTGIGEPTLYSGFKELCNLIKTNFQEIKIGLNTNGALFYKKDIRNDFLECDLILISFSTIFQEEYRSICRPHEDLNLNEIMEGIKLFKASFQNKFGIITFIINGINNSEQSALALKSYITSLNPDYLFLYNYQCCGYSPISQEFNNFLKELYKDVPFRVIFKF